MKVDIFQPSLFVAEFQNSQRDAWERAIRVVGGALCFERLGHDGRVQSMYRDLAIIRAVLQEVSMSKGKSLPQTAKVSNIHWVNYKLNDVDKAQFDAWLPEPAEVAGSIIEMVDEGYRFTLGYDKYKGSVSVTCIAPAEGTPNTGRGYSTFARSWDKVWALTAFKHYVVFQQEWPDAVAPASVEDYG